MDNDRIKNLDKANQPILLWNCQRAILIGLVENRLLLFYYIKRGGL